MGRRSIWILVAGVVLLTHAAALTAQTAVVVNQGTGGTGNVSVIAPNLAVTTVSLAAGSVPVDIAANPAGTVAAIADQNGPRIQFLDLTMNPPTLSNPSVSVAGSGATAQASIQDVRFSSDGACLVEAGGGRIKSIRMSDRTVVTSLDLASVVAVDIARNSVVLALTPSSLKFLDLGAGCVLVDIGLAPVSDPNLVGANNIAISPNSQIALVTNSSAAAGGNTVAVFSLNPVLCGSNFVNAIAVGTAGVSGATGVAITPDGTRAYVRVPNVGVKILNIDASNAVADSGTSISGTSAGSAAVPGAKDIATDGTRLFFSNNTGSTSMAGTVGVVNVGSTMQLPGSPVTAGILPVAMAAVAPVVVPRPVALVTNNNITPSMTSGSGGSISVIGPDLTILGTLTLDYSDFAYAVVVNPAGTLAAAAVQTTIPASDAVIQYYSLAAGLPALSTPSTDLGGIDQVQDIAFSGNGACLVAAQFASRLVSIRMSDRTVVSSLPFSDIVAVDAGSNNVVLALRDGGAVTSIEVLTLDPATCALTDVRTVNDTMPKSLDLPTNITISPNGQLALVANVGRNLVDLSKHETNVVEYAITGSGASTNLGAPVLFPAGVTDTNNNPVSFPVAIAFKPDGSIAYAHIEGPTNSGVRAYNVSGTTVTDAGFLSAGTAGRSSTAFKGTDDIATDGVRLFVVDGISQSCPSSTDVIRISDNAILSQGTMFGTSMPTAVAIVPPSAQPTTTNVAPASGQYSDPVTLSATVSPAAAGSMQFLVAASPVGTVAVNSGTGVATLPYTISQGAGSYTITAQFTNSDPGFLNSSGTNTLTVGKEDATVTPSASNPASVQVASPGGTSPPFALSATIIDLSDGTPGNTMNATPVTCTLSPIAPGAPIIATASTTGGGVGLPLTATCNFSGVPVNVYNVTFTIGGNFYQGSGQSSVIVFDPSLGFVTGGGRVANPNTGALANFGFNVKSKKDGSSQGSLTYVEHRPGGDVMLKSSSMGPLVIVGNEGIFAGTATLNGVDNYSFRVIVIDNGEPGTSDRFGLQVIAPGGTTVADLTFSPATIASGNIQLH